MNFKDMSDSQKAKYLDDIVNLFENKLTKDTIYILIMLPEKVASPDSVMTGNIDKKEIPKLLKAIISTIDDGNTRFIPDPLTN